MRYKSLFFLPVIFLMSCGKPKARRPINKPHSLQKDTSVEINKAWMSIEQNQINHYIKKDTAFTYTYSPYGFAYAKIQSSSKEKKSVYEGSVLQYSKKVYTLSNKLIYDTTFETCKIGKSNLPKGIQEGLKLMHQDAEFKFIFSSFVAYGFHGDNHKIGANTPIIIHIKLLKINN